MKKKIVFLAFRLRAIRTLVLSIVFNYFLKIKMFCQKMFDDFRYVGKNRAALFTGTLKYMVRLQTCSDRGWFL